MTDDIVIGPTRPPEPGINIGPGPKGATGKPPTGCVRLSSDDFHPQLRNIAAKFLKNEWGTLTPFRIGDKYYMARVEPHFRKPTTNPQLLTQRKQLSIPEGWHKGVTVYKVQNTTTIQNTTPTGTKEVKQYTPDKTTDGRVLFLNRLDKLISDIEKG